MGKCCLLVWTLGLFPHWIFAQYDSVLNNPDVVWAAETDILYVFSKKADTLSLYKDPSEPAPHKDSEYMMRRLLQTAAAGDWPAWDINDTSVPISKAAVQQVLGSRDTFSEDSSFTYPFTNPALYYGLNVRQLLYYNIREGNFCTCIDAIAPVLQIADQPATPLFWLKMPPCWQDFGRRLPDVNDSDYTWATRIATNRNSPMPDSLPFYRKKLEIPLMQHLLDRFKSDSTFTIEPMNGKPLSMGDRYGMVVKQDTMIICFPEHDDDPTTKVVYWVLEAKDLARIDLDQRWYWNERRKRLEIYTVGFAPAVRVQDNEGNFRFYRTLFWKRYR